MGKTTVRQKNGRRPACFLAGLLLLMLFSAILQMPAFADDFDEQLAALNSEKDVAKEKRITAQNKVQALKEEQAAFIEKKMAFEERREACIEELSVTEEQISLIVARILEYDKKIEDKMAEVQAAQQKEEAQLVKYRVRLRAMEENGEYNILAVFLNADSYSSLLAAVDDYGDLMESDVVLYDRLQEARQEHQRVEQEYREVKADYEEKKAEQELIKTELEADKEELEDQIAETDAVIEEYLEKIEKAEEEQRAAEQAEANASAAVDQFLANYYAAQAAAAQQTTTVVEYNEETGTYEEYTYTEQTVTVSAGGTRSFVWPFPGHTVITSTYGYRESTGTTHTGVDIDGYQSAGSPIVAADGGTVIMAEYSGGYGNCIMIDHGNGLVTLYGHLNSMYVSVGSTVSQGQTIGGVGNTGTTYGADGVHLHFEVRVNGSTVDPMNYIGGYPHTYY